MADLPELYSWATHCDECGDQFVPGGLNAEEEQEWRDYSKTREFAEATRTMTTNEMRSWCEIYNFGCPRCEVIAPAQYRTIPLQNTEGWVRLLAPRHFNPDLPGEVLVVEGWNLRRVMAADSGQKLSEISRSQIQAGLVTLLRAFGTFDYIPDGQYVPAVPLIDKARVSEGPAWRELRQEYESLSQISATWKYRAIGDKETDTWECGTKGNLVAFQFSALAARTIRLIGLGTTSKESTEDRNRWLSMLRQQFGLSSITYTFSRFSSSMTIAGSLDDVGQMSIALVHEIEARVPRKNRTVDESLAITIPNAAPQNGAWFETVQAKYRRVHQRGQLTQSLLTAAAGYEPKATLKSNTEVKAWLKDTPRSCMAGENISKALLRIETDLDQELRELS